MTDPPPPAVLHRAGWYPDPTKQADERFYDGKTWTSATRASVARTGMPPHRRRVTAVVVVIVAYIAASFADASRTCATPEFGLPTSCDPVAVWFAVLFAIVLVINEIVQTGRDRMNSRECPRCGHRVRVGTLDCGSCGFNFRTVTGR